MRFLRRLFALALLVAVLLLGLMFSLNNNALVPLDLLVVQLEERRSAIYLIAFFIAGGVLGMLVSAVTIVRLRTRLLALRRRLDGCEQELGKLRSAPLKG